MTARRALVTGASSGIGAATARELAHAGYRVALLARRKDELEALARELPSPPGESHVCLSCDLTVPAEIERAFGELERAFGGLELLVNNAGSGYRALVEELEPELLRRVFDTNVIGLLLACKAALPLLVRGTRPVVIDVASVVGRRGIPGQAAYSASKAAVVSIGEALRLEWAEHGIAVCTLNPGLTATGFFEAQPNPSRLQAPELRTAHGPEHVARAILALDRRPRAELSMRSKWRWLALLSIVWPKLADAFVERRLGFRRERALRDGS